MTKVFCLFPQLGLVGGGKIKVIYDRLNILANDPRFEPILLTVRHNVNQRAIFAKLKKRGTISEGVYYHTLSEVASAAYPNRAPGTAQPNQFENLITRVEAQHGTERKRAISVFSEDDGEVIETFVGDQRVSRRQYFEDSLILDIAFLLDGRELRREYAHGRLVSCYLYQNNIFKSGYNALLGRRFFNERKFFGSFMRLAASDGSITIADGITLAYLTIPLNSPKAIFLHADHREPDGQIARGQRAMIEGFSGDLLITTTDRHKALIQKDLKPKAPIFVVTHGMTAPDIIIPQTERQHICTVSRIDLEGKPIDQSIRAFAAIMDRIPNIDYHIYGDGTGLSTLRKLIQTLGCKNRVFLKGYTHQPQAVFAGSICSLYPTITEGFGMSILESLIHHTPVITYDVDIGPRELIAPGLNGELVEVGNIEALSSAILKVISDPEAYAAGCVDTSQRYSREHHVALTLAAMDEILAQHSKRHRSNQQMA